MNDNVKNTLYEIVREARNLSSSELERISGTDIYVKKGRTKEFNALAYQYYEYLYNVKITDNMDYVTDIYKQINNDIEQEANEYYDAKSYEVFKSNEQEIKRLKALMSSSKTLNSVYDKLAREMQNTLSITDLKTRQTKIEEISKQIKENIDNIETIKKEMMDIREKVNSNVLKVIEEQMNLIVKEYQSTTRGVNIAFGIDGTSVLAKDKIEYDSLYTLKNILNNVKDEELVIIDNFICANPIQVETIKDLLPKVNIFKRLKVKEKEVEEIKEEDNKNLNEELLSTITNELRRLEEKRLKQRKASSIALNNIRVLNEDLEEYNNLIKIAQILNRAPKEYGSLVWDKAYVAPNDVVTFKNLMSSTKLFKNANLDEEKMNKYQVENQEMISKLENYLDELAKSISNYPGYTNLPIKETKKIGDKVWIVASNDLIEANNIIDIINMLNDVSLDMVNIPNVGNIKATNYDYVNYLLTKTKYFNKPEEKIEKVELNFKVNDQRIKYLEEQIKLMQDNYDKHIIKEENIKELIKLYQDEIALLNSSKVSSNPVLIYGIYIDSNREEEYKKLLNSEEEIIKKAYQTLNDEKISLSKDIINNLSNINETYPDSLKKAMKEITEIHKRLIEYLNKAKNTTNLMIVDNYVIVKEDNLDFKLLLNNLINANNIYNDEKKKYEENEKTENIDLQKNDKYIKESEENILFLQDLIKDKATDIEVAQKAIELSNKILDILNKAKDSKDLELFEDVYINKEDKEIFKNTLNELDNCVDVIFANLNNNNISNIDKELEIWGEEQLKPKASNVLRDLNDKIILNLQSIKDYLVKAKRPEADITNYKGYYVEAENFDKFKILINNLDSLKDKYNAMKDDKDNSNKEKLNNDKIIELTLLLQSKAVNNNDVNTFQYMGLNFSNDDREIVYAIIKMKNLLLKALNTEVVQKYNDVYLVSEDIEVYQNCENYLKSLKNKDNHDEHNNNHGSNGGGGSSIEDDSSLGEDNSNGRKKVRVRKPKNKNSHEFIKNHWKFIVGAGLTLGAVTYFISALPTLAPALIYANSCCALSLPSLAGLFNGLSSIIAHLSGITYANGAFLMANGAIINAGIATSHAFGATIKALAPFAGLGAAFIVDKKLFGKKKEKHVTPEEEAKEKTTVKEYILTLLSKMRASAYKIKSSLADIIHPYPDDEEVGDYVHQVEDLMLNEHSNERTLTNE